MRSSEGLYLERLDHLRALAVFMVFFWHFVHGSAMHPALPSAFAPQALGFPASLFEEGHAGVALFMVLSGYLFTKLIGTRDIAYGAFLRNRALRLFPMLALVLIPGILRGEETIGSVAMGFIRDGWSADGTWSVMVELQFYALLPFLLILMRKKPLALTVTVVAAAVGLRTAIWLEGGDIKHLATYSLIGRIDNFIIGMGLARLEGRARTEEGLNAPRYQVIAAITFGLFLVFYHAFNSFGGMETSPDSPIWIALPTVESFAFAALIFAYCGTRQGLPRPVGRMLAKIGEASYSIYLLQFIVISAGLGLMASWHISAWSFGALALLSLPWFGVCFSLGWVTYTCIEKPFLRLRVPYLRHAAEAGAKPTSLTHISTRNVHSLFAP